MNYKLQMYRPRWSLLTELIDRDQPELLADEELRKVYKSLLSIPTCALVDLLCSAFCIVMAMLDFIHIGSSFMQC